MKRRSTIGQAALVLGIALVALASGSPARAHCDTLDGPVVKDARTALAKGQVTPVLKWIKPQAEPEIRAAFRKTLAVRQKGPEAKEIADRYFFETLVRVHRAGEGAPFTGLKPAGEVEPPIAAADRALAAGNADALEKQVARDVAEGIQKRFARVAAARKHANESVEAGRRYVAAYVDYIHYVERLHNTAAGSGAGEHAESAQVAHEE